jgi:hypothetical protein
MYIYLYIYSLSVDCQTISEFAGSQSDCQQIENQVILIKEQKFFNFFFLSTSGGIEPEAFNRQ